MADAGITQAVLAQRCGIAANHLNAYVRARRSPNMWTMMVIDEALEELVDECS
jgi:transcriptional regulator with XRE-family HTH domain